MRTVFIIAFSAILFFGLGSCKDLPDEALNEQQTAARILEQGSPWGGAGKVLVLQPENFTEGSLFNLSIDFTTTQSPFWNPDQFGAQGADEFLSIEGSSATWSWISNSTENISLSGASSSQLNSMIIQEDTITFTFEVSIDNGKVLGLAGEYRVSMLSRNE